MGVREEPDWQTNAAFRETIADVREGRFSECSHLVEMEVPFLDEVVHSIGGAASENQD